MPEEHPLTILGAGYVGRALLQRFPDAAVTHRQALPESNAHAFRLDDQDTWANPPIAGRAIIWTFPAQPLEQVKDFYNTRLGEAEGLLVLGSTSAYRLSEAGAPTAVTVDEQTPLDMTKPWVQGEEWLRARGATILQLAGIFGPERDPAGWLRRGRIKDGAKIVNLIHVDDIVAVVAHLLSHPLPGERLNVSNGEPEVWRDLAARFQQKGLVPADLELPERTPHERGKRVDVHRLQGLMPNHRFRRP